MKTKIKPRELVTLTRRLADLLEGGLTLSRSLTVLEAQSGSPAVRNVLRGISGNVQNGLSFSEALSRENGSFPALYTGLIRAGESAGTPEKSLAQLAQLLEKDAETRERLRAALAYPAILLFMTAAVAVFLIGFVVPKFQFLFDELGQNLPWPTRILMELGGVFRSQTGLMLLLLAALTGIFLATQKTRWPSLTHSFVIVFPGVSGWFQSAALERWARGMGGLLQGGFPLLEALSISERTLRAAFGQERLRLIETRVASGEGLGQALAAAAFPPVMCEMVEAGEESGRLEEVFPRIAEAYRRETEGGLKLALTFLEPALILIMGAVVGFVAVAMLLPIFQISGGIQ